MYKQENRDKDVYLTEKCANEAVKYYQEKMSPLLNNLKNKYLKFFNNYVTRFPQNVTKNNYKILKVDSPLLVSSRKQSKIYNIKR